MALTESQELQMRTPCPSFTLSSVDGKTYSLDDFKDSKALLVAFICSHCPYVQAIEDEFIALSKAFPKENLQTIGICSNDAAKYPEDSPESLLKRWHAKNYEFPYLVDTTQKVAQAFDAVCTPDLFLYNADRQLYYHGRFQDLKSAITDLVAGKEPPQDQKHSIGCSIKWFD
ncbi:MAG: thioredoxin family protein [Deltaproteobacteria bacterium]|nr:thioredoxin family protein [Deltaproteobacteria bacterium]